MIPEKLFQHLYPILVDVGYPLYFVASLPPHNSHLSLLTFPFSDGARFRTLNSILLVRNPLLPFVFLSRSLISIIAQQLSASPINPNNILLVAWKKYDVILLSLRDHLKTRFLLMKVSSRRSGQQAPSACHSCGCRGGGRSGLGAGSTAFAWYFTSIILNSLYVSSFVPWRAHYFSQATP